MFCATFDDVGDIPIGEMHCVGAIGDHCSQERVDSGHTILTTHPPNRHGCALRTNCVSTPATSTLFPVLINDRCQASAIRLQIFSQMLYRRLLIPEALSLTPGTWCVSVA